MGSNSLFGRRLYDNAHHRIDVESKDEVEFCYFVKEGEIKLTKGTQPPEKIEEVKNYKKEKQHGAVSFYIEIADWKKQIPFITEYLRLFARNEEIKQLAENAYTEYKETNAHEHWVNSEISPQWKVYEDTEYGNYLNELAETFQKRFYAENIDERIGCIYVNTDDLDEDIEKELDTGLSAERGYCTISYAKEIESLKNVISTDNSETKKLEKNVAEYAEKVFAEILAEQ